MTWYYRGDAFTPEQIGENKAFVYSIYNALEKKFYIGKKKFRFSVVRKPLKGKKRKRRSSKDSDWEDYYGSSNEVKADIEKHGVDKFYRQILRLCKTAAEASYYELKLQLEYDVLLKPKEFYNNYVGARIHRNHLIK